MDLQAGEVKQGLPEALLDQAGKSKMLEDEAKKKEMQKEEDKAKKKEMQLEKDLKQQDLFKAAQEMDRDTNKRKEQGKELDKQEDEATKKVKLEPGISASPDAVGMNPAKKFQRRV